MSPWIIWQMRKDWVSRPVRPTSFLPFAAFSHCCPPRSGPPSRAPPSRRRLGLRASCLLLAGRSEAVEERVEGDLVGSRLFPRRVSGG
jgi:hypothetical protein